MSTEAFVGFVIAIVVAVVGAAASILGAVISVRAARNLEGLRAQLAKNADERTFAYAKAKALHERQMDVAGDLWVAASALKSAASRAIGGPVRDEEARTRWKEAVKGLQAADEVCQAAARAAAPFLPQVRTVVADLDKRLQQAFALDQDR